MVQVKKIEVEQAITVAAYELFRAHGYSGTRMPQIAKAAGISASNIYVYFGAKVDILISIYENWFAVRLDELKKQVKQCQSPEEALRKLFTAMWRDLPAADNGFCGILIEALSDRAVQDKYSPQLRDSIEASLRKMLAQCLPQANRKTHKAVASMLIMAFDGYALNYHLRKGQIDSDDDIAAICELILGAQAPRAKPRKPKP